MNESVVLKDIINQRVKPLKLPVYWAKFLGVVPYDQFTMQVFGPAGSGKSTFALKLADTLGLYGNVLYCNFEENLLGGTIQNKARLARVSRLSRIFFLPDNISSDSFEENYNFIVGLLRSGKFNFCVIDSVSEIVSNIAEEKKLIGLKNKFSDITFIYLFHVEKTKGIYLGSSKSIHRLDIIIKIEEGVAKILKNRYQKGKKSNDLQIFRQ